jgi:hypothetical protein
MINFVDLYLLLLTIEHHDLITIIYRGNSILCEFVFIYEYIIYCCVRLILYSGGEIHCSR